MNAMLEPSTDATSTQRAPGEDRGSRLADPRGCRRGADMRVSRPQRPADGSSPSTEAPEGAGSGRASSVIAWPVEDGSTSGATTRTSPNPAATEASAAMPG